MKRLFSGIMLTLLLTSMLTMAFNVQPVKAEGTIYIRADGSVDPPTAPIHSVDNVTYTFTGNINDSIVIERDNTVVDGAAYTLDGTGASGSQGIKLAGRNNVTIRNIEIKACGNGVLVANSSYNSIYGNNIANNNGHGICLSDYSSYNSINGNNITANKGLGIYLYYYCSHNSVYANNIANNAEGIELGYSPYNDIYGNNITANNQNGIFLCYSSYSSIYWNIIAATNQYDGILLRGSSYNSIRENVFINSGLLVTDSYQNSVENNTVNGRPLAYLEGVSNCKVDDAGQVALVRCNNIRVEGLNLSRAGVGVELWETQNTIIYANNIANNNHIGIYLHDSSNNSISENNIANSYCGISLSGSSENFIYHNNFLSNINQVWTYGSVNVWDNGYPSGGNYWSDYTDVDLNHDGIWDHPYIINANNTDHYPLVNPWTPPKFEIDDQVQTTANLKVREGPGLDCTIISTMPLGTIGQVVGGPAEADGFVWWDVSYAGGVRGWSAENWLELHSSEAPTCVVELQKDGIKTSEVGVGEFFDIYVGGSYGDTDIKHVRFSSDNVQDGYPTGEWTDWFDWDVSSEDWYAATKIKRWAFDTPGYKEVWAEVKDETDQTAFGLATIFVPAPALPVLISPLVITPMKNLYNVGDSLEAGFTIKNIGDVPITLDILTVGGRLNGFVPPEGAPDFTFQAVTLQPNEPYQYRGSLTLTQMGNYRFFVAYYIGNPTPDEERLLDDNNWNTCVELGEGLAHDARVRDIIVYKEGIVPEEVSRLSQGINNWINRQRQLPAYLIDPKVSWAGSVWISISSMWSHVQEQYDELWQAAVDHDTLSQIEAIHAKTCLEKGDIDWAREHMQGAFDQDKISHLYVQASIDVYDNNMEQAEVAVKGALDVIQFGLTLTNPPAGKFAGYVFMIAKYVPEIQGPNETPATIKLLGEVAFKFLFDEVEYPSLGGRTLGDYLNNRVGKLTFPVLQDLFANNEALQFQLSHTLKRIVTWETGWLSGKILDELSKLFPSKSYTEFSPVELRVIDSEGRITGIVNGTVRHDIPGSLYRNETVTIFFPPSSDTCEVVGQAEGTYGLRITQTEDRNTTCFTATGIPTSLNATHQYTADWNALQSEEEGVTVLVDVEGDGLVDRVFSCDSELASQEFIEKTSPTYPTHALTVSAGSNGTTFPPLGTYVCSANSTVQVTALPDEGYVLDYWEFDSVQAGSENPYRVLVDADHTLNATFRLGIHDIGVTDVSSFKMVVGESFSLDVNVTVANLGDFTEAFNVTLYANGTFIVPKIISLTSRASKAITFTWNTSGFARGNYLISAYAEPIPGETYTADNNCTSGLITVTIPGDVTGDVWVDMQDISILIDNFMATPPNWNPNCDVDNDLSIDMADISIAIDHFMQT